MTNKNNKLDLNQRNIRNQNDQWSQASKTITNTLLISHYQAILHNLFIKNRET